MTKNEAEKLSVLLVQVAAKLDESVAYVKDKDTEDHFKSFRRDIALVMACLYNELKAPLWERFPDLKPEYLNGPYEIDPSIYEPKFYKSDET